jgi:DNA-binding transcriptional MerR regulator
MAKKSIPLVGTSYAARILGVSETMIRHLAEAGKLKVRNKTVDGRRFFHPLDVERLKAAREQDAPAVQLTRV